MLEAMQFTGTWRDYQQRVLDEFEQHIDDHKINVVAAPGSGKTVLGLELVRRIGRPAIILAPSLTIRNQWSERLVPLFMSEAPPPGFVAHTLEAPAQLTGATYQALHAIWADDGQQRFGALLEWARTNGPMTLVLDEAHHLRREWWRALDALVAGLGDVRVVALTATPPYDAPLAEWRRFEEVCGPIDIEIGIPELVRNGDLCPHQDHIVFSRPNPDLLALLDQRRAAISDIAAAIRADAALADEIAEHPWLRLPLNYLQPILENPTILSSMLVHLAAIGRPLPKEPLRLLGVDAASAPPQNERWFEALLNALLYDLGDTSPLAPDGRKALAVRLHAQGLIEGERVRLGETKRIIRMMAGDRVKIASIAHIAEVEAGQQGADLRMVVLADHVRGSDLPKRETTAFEPTKIGVAPIFEVLRRKSLPKQSLGVLTGTLVILPTAACEALRELGKECGIAPGELRPTRLAHCDTHHAIVAGRAGRKALVSLVTELFQRGELTILFGTQALLGEGWDAPAINSLVLASNSASYMLSNQMRGRAIRKDPHRPDKVSNIWHLATVTGPEAIGGLEAPAQHLDWGAIPEGQAMSADIKLLARRFEAFACISNGGTQRIGTGIARLDLTRHDTLHGANSASFARAADRSAIARDWVESLGDAPSRAHVREVAAPRHSPRRMVWRNTLEALGIGGLASGATAGSYALLASLGAQPLTVLLAGATTTATLASLPKIARALRLAWRNGSLENSLAQVGQMVLFGLREAGLLSDSEFALAKVRTEARLDGSRALYFEGLSRSVDIAAMDSLVELLGPIQNPRYILVRRGGIAGKGKDLHAIPALLSKNREMAERFAHEWSRRVGPCEAMWTRSERGRRFLLHARRASLAAGMQRAIDRRSEWR
jgi:hypothetical protein